MELVIDLDKIEDRDKRKWLIDLLELMEIDFEVFESAIDRSGKDHLKSS